MNEERHYEAIDKAVRAARRDVLLEVAGRMRESEERLSAQEVTAIIRWAERLEAEAEADDE